MLCYTLDEEVPVFIYTPASKTKNNDPGKPYARVYWPKPEVTDNSGLVTVTTNRHSGTLFVKTTVVTYRAVDGSGNTAFSSFTVTVKGTFSFSGYK